MAADVVHSDLPLFHGGENAWPQPFGDGDSFGCASRVEFGDWVMREAGAQDDDDAQWYRIENYGVFHCWALVGEADQREDLEKVELRPSFFVLLGTTEIEHSVTELWVVQMGARPGSDYLFLSRARNDGAIERFNVLQTQCPRANVRDGGTLSILYTRYCAINTRGELLRLARRMAQRPPRGTLSHVDAG